MTKIIPLEQFNTSHGLVFVLDETVSVKIGEIVEFEGDKYRIKEIIFPSRPSSLQQVTVFVEKLI